MRLNKCSFRSLIILMLALVPAFVAATTIVAVPVHSSLSPFPRPAAVAPLDNHSTTFEPTFQPTLVYVQVSTVTTTVTSTSQATVTESTTSVQSVSVTETKSESFTTTSTTVAGFVPGVAPDMNIPILLVALLAGGVIGGGAAWTTIINSTKSNTFRTARRLLWERDRGLLNGFCGRCDKLAQNSICTGCGLSTATCTCVMETPGCNVKGSKSNSDN